MILHVAVRSGPAAWSSARACGLAAAAGVVLYVAIDVALVFLRPHLSVLHSAESDYGSRGAWAWLMDVNFVLRGAFSLLAVRALALRLGPTRRRAGFALISIWAVASALLAFFPDDPVGTKTHGAGRIHLLLAAIAFVAVAVGTRTLTRTLARDADWRPVVPLLAILSWGALVPVLLLGHSRLRPHSLGGLYEKLFLGVEIAWLLAAALWSARAGATTRVDVSGSESTAPQPT